MVLKKWTNSVATLMAKYRYVLIILLIGLILMIMPNNTKANDNESKSAITVEKSTAPSLESRLSQLLSKVEGAGNVEVILTIAEGEEIVYQINEGSTSSDTSNTINVDTVTITDSSRNQTGLIKQILPERYQGAVIVCDGADIPSVRLQIVDAVSRATGLGANCICVLKMK